MQLNDIYKLIKTKLKETERLIQFKLQSDVPIISRLGSYITRSGGKRIRPALLCLAARACGYNGDSDVKFGVVFEFVHTATLIHDDIIDQADTRRGQQVINKKFGTTLSILFGDQLFNTAMGMAVEEDDFRIVRLINQATARMIEGEIVQSERNYKTDISMDDYIDLIKRKTAFVFAATAQSAPILANIGTEAEKEFFKYGLNLGMAFQLIDDYFDYTSSEKTLGKPVGADLQEGKITYPILKLLEKGDDKVLPIITQSFKKRSIEEDSLHYIISKLRSSGALEETKLAAEEYAQQAINSLTVLQPSKYTEALMKLPLFVVERTK